MSIGIHMKTMASVLVRGRHTVPRISRQMSSGGIQYDADKISSGLVAGNRFMLSKAITLVESTREDHRIAGSKILDMALQKATERTKEKRGQNMRGSFRLGISGPPGVGKSTFIESVGMHLLKLGYKIAVVAVDPSSHISGGSILGDKTRMTELGLSPNAFIRPCATSGQLGGIAQHTDEIVLLCESAGYDMVLIETVGVGQSEVLVAEIADMFLLLLPPAGGDSLQGMKRGIVEAADLIVINKADGDLLMPAKRAQAEYRNGLHYINSQNSWWHPDVLTCSSLKGDGVDKVWEKADSFWDLGTSNGAIETRRGKQRAKWMWKKAEGDICRLMRQHPDLQKMAAEYKGSLGRGEHSPRWAAERMVKAFLDSSWSADYQVQV